MRGKVQLPGTVAPGHDEYESGLRDRPADLERSCALTPIAPEYASAYQSAAEGLEEASLRRVEEARLAAGTFLCLDCSQQFFAQ